MYVYTLEEYLLLMLSFCSFSGKKERRLRTKDKDGEGKGIRFLPFLIVFFLPCPGFFSHLFLASFLTFFPPPSFHFPFRPSFSYHCRKQSTSFVLSFRPLFPAFFNYYFFLPSLPWCDCFFLRSLISSLLPLILVQCLSIFKYDTVPRSLF